MSEPKHSPLPWWTDGKDDVRDVNGDDVSLVANAAIIVRAVNSHAELLAAAKEARSTLDFIAPGLRVLRNMIHHAGLRIGAAKAEELMGACDETLSSLKVLITKAESETP